MDIGDQKEDLTWLISKRINGIKPSEIEDYFPQMIS